MKPWRQLFAFPFRVFFVSAAAWAVLAVSLWALQVSGLLSLPLAYPPFLWHRHEMLFGFLNPAIAGFLLTAVCVWTGTERLHGPPLLLLWLVWLSGRVIATWGGQDAAGWGIAIDLAFLPLVALDAGRRIVGARQWRQLVVLMVIALLWLMQAGTLTRGPAIRGPAIYTDGALILAAALMLIIGGRITPTFSANWLRGRGEDPTRVRTLFPLELALLTSLFLLLIAALLEHAGALTVMAIVTALLTLARLGLWRGWLFRREPLLWILHLSLLWIPAALLLLAGHQVLGWPATAWQHALGIGAMGGLILGVMTRVALGHTGRPLQLPAGMVAAYGLIQVAALVRLLTVFLVVPWQWGIGVSAIAWVAAFALFLWRYLPVLWSPRADGKPG
jgi:uncharacterized protein involved in response to NO